MNNEQLESFLKEEREKLESCKDEKCKMTILNNIIQIESEIKNELYQDNLYKDIKKYIISYISAVNDESYDYDSISMDKLFVHNNLLSNEKKISILLITERVLLDKCFINEANMCRDHIRRLRYYCSLRKKNFKITEVILSLLSYCASSAKNTLITVSIFIILAYFVTLPAPFEFMETISFTSQKICNNYYANHLANTFCLMLDIGETKAIPVSPIGLFGIILFKTTWLIFVVNFLISESIKKALQ
jgi:hypothetical protein